MVTDEGNPPTGCNRPIVSCPILRPHTRLAGGANQNRTRSIFVQRATECQAAHSQAQESGTGISIIQFTPHTSRKPYRVKSDNQGRP